LNSILIQLIGSALAVALMVGLAAWARIPRPTEPLDEATARDLIETDYPAHPIDAVWIAADGMGAIARSGSHALVLAQLGDSWVTRDMAWETAIASPIRGGRVRLRTPDPAAPKLSLAVSGVTPWPPQMDPATLEGMVAA
jgi:HAMP domain-containing protein